MCKIVDKIKQDERLNNVCLFCYSKFKKKGEEINE